MSTRHKLLEEIVENADAIRKRVFMRGGMPKSDLTPQQFLALRIIGHHAGCTVKDLAQKMQMTSSAATQLVDKLVENKYVTRTESAEDRRAVALAPSEKMKEKLKEFKAHAMKKMMILFEALTDEELTEYIALQRKIINRTNS